MKTVSPEAVSGQTFCSKCDEAICDCTWLGMFATVPTRYTIIDGEPYIIHAPVKES